MNKSDRTLLVILRSNLEQTYLHMIDEVDREEVYNCYVKICNMLIHDNKHIIKELEVFFLNQFDKWENEQDKIHFAEHGMPRRYTEDKMTRFKKTEFYTNYLSNATNLENCYKPTKIITFKGDM